MMMVDSKSPSPEARSKNKTRPKWSTVWMHCTDMHNGRAICNICGAGLAYHSHISTSTYNLKRHLRLKHPTLGLSRKKRHVPLRYNLIRADGHKRSSVWDHCTIVGDRKVKCDLCGAELVYINASTHNLKRHLESRHTAEELQNNASTLAEREPEMQSTADDEAVVSSSGKKPSRSVLCSAISVALGTETSVSSGPIWSDDESELDLVERKPTLSGTKQRLFDEALFEMIVLDFQPISIVEDAGFRDFVSQLQPAYVIPRQRTIHDVMLPQRYDRLLSRRRIEMQDAIGVCLTIEGWTSFGVARRYFAVTGHYLGTELDMKTWLLDAFEYSDQHTITYLKDELVRITEEWQIQDKVVAVVSDNISEVLTAIELIGWTRLPCFTHTMNAIANEALAEIDEILIKIRTVVEFFRCNATASEMLKSMLQHLSQPDVDLMQDVTPHWTSTYHMMLRFFQVRDAIINTLTLINEPCLQLLSWADWDVITRACDLMMALYEAAVEISAEKYMSASKGVVMVKGLLRLCREHVSAPGQLPTIEKMASVMISSITNWFGNMELNPLLAETMLLDPRFKRSGFADSNAADLAVRSLTESASLHASGDKSNSYAKEQAEAKTNDVGEVRTLQLSVWDDYDRTVSGIVATTHPLVKLSPRMTNTSASGQMKSSSVWSDYDQKVSIIAASVDSPDAEAAKQMQRFLDEPLLSRQDDCLEWWKSRIAVYPRLLPLVRERLCIVATSVSSDNIFSTAGWVLNDRRRSLRPSEVRSRVFLNTNIRP